ncbi:acetyltransferase [Vibrio brasiliensis]|uniref:acetyltransferase n=1 Tax=Vibrio brasiliensis TaxID=170652 RepID=UPI0023D8C95D|nr:acetyltransferase [Vibrio brasiliensis]
MRVERKPPIILIGGGGHASVLADILFSQGREIRAIISPNNLAERKVFSSITHLKNDDDILSFPRESVLLVNGIGMMPNCALRQNLTSFYLDLGYSFETVIASTAIVSPYAKISSGAQVFPNAVVNTGASIGEHSIINTGAVIEHDSVVESFCHVAPKAIICGQALCSSGSFIGAGATVIQNVRLGKNIVVGAGETIRRDRL